MPRLTGGSAGEVTQKFSHPFFYPDVKVIDLQAKNTYGVRILPAFGKTTEDDSAFGLDPTSQAYRLSVREYRDREVLDADGRAIFTNWYYSLQGHKFIGNGRRGFLSPLMLQGKDASPFGLDPLFDICMYAKKHAEFSHLLEKGTNRNATLSWPRKFGVVNTLVDIEGSMVNTLAVMSDGGLTDLKEQLDELRPAILADPSDPNWPDYAYGDVTSMDYGLYAQVRETPINAAGFKTACFHFSQNRKQFTGMTPYPLPADSSCLEERFDIGDTKHVTRLYEDLGQEILDYVVHDGFLPHDLIESACSHHPHWTIPVPKNRTYSTPPMDAPAPNAQAAAQQRTAPPRSPNASPAPTAPPAPAPAARPAPVTQAPPLAPARPPVSQTAPPLQRPPAPPAAARPVTQAPPAAAPVRPLAPPAPPARPAAPPAATPRPSPASNRPPAAPPATAQRPPAPVARPASSAPRLAPVAPPAPPAPVEDAPAEQDDIPYGETAESGVDTNTVPLTQEELDEYASYEARFSNEPGSLQGPEMTRMLELGARMTQV